MRAIDNVFHLKCFLCVVCGVRLQKGDQYVIKQSQLFCRPDYEKEVEMLQGYNYGKNALIWHWLRDEMTLMSLTFSSQTTTAARTFIMRELTEEEDQSDLGERVFIKEAEDFSFRNYRRTILTTQQRRAFKASFDVSPKPCRKVREGLAKDTGLSIRIVQVWFQNQRCFIYF